MTTEAKNAVAAALVIAATYSAPWTIGIEYMIPVLGIGSAGIVLHSFIAGYLED